MQLNLCGTGVALVTPFHKNGSIDYPTLEKIIEYVIEGGVDYIVSLGSTGESIPLNSEECRAVLDFTIKTVKERLPIIAGLFGDNFTARLVANTKRYNLDGFAAIMSSSPAYIKPTQEGIYQHYMKLAEVATCPIIIYNVPGRTASKIAPETIIRLANASEKFIAVKDATGDLVDVSTIVKNKPKDFFVLSGDDPTALPAIACGADGVISVIANAYPAIFSKMVKAALQGDFKTAQALHFKLLDIHPLLYIEGNPAGIKGAMEILGICNKTVRLPLTEISEQTLSALKKEMEKVASKKALAI